MSTGVMLFNPFTGAPRHPDDIKSDPDGFLLWDGEARLRAAQAAQPAHHLPDAGNMVAQPAQNEWKEAVIEQLAAHSMDAPVSDSPTIILEKIIDIAVLQATDPAVNGGWKLVPVEPTPEMIGAYVSNNVRFQSATSDWAVMLAAAPSPKE